jgi:UrcA family protein
MTRISVKLGATVAAVALTTLMLVTADARAAESIELAPSVQVQYAPEELDTDKGAANVYRKLKKAARRLCGIDGGFLNLHEKTAAQKCVDETLATAVRKIDRPMLTSLHASRSREVG